MHRHRLGKFWRESKTTCQYPKHSGENKQVKGRGTVGFQMAKEIMTYRECVPVGSRMFIIRNLLFRIVLYLGSDETILRLALQYISSLQFL